MRIEPGIGVGRIRFDWTPSEAEAELGAPDRVGTVQADGAEWIEWHYDAQGVCLYFDAADGSRLVLVDVDDDRVELEGIRLVGREEDDLLADLHPLGELEVEDEGDGRRVWELLDAEVFIWFRDGRCDSVQVGALDDDDLDDDELDDG